MESPIGTKILIVDDHPVVRAGLAASLCRDASLILCGEAQTVPEAMSEIFLRKPDLVLVDLDLENGSGLDLIKKAREANPDLRFLVLSMHDEDLYAERALRAGAHGYVMKQEQPAGLIAAIHTVMEGRIAVSEKIASKVLRHYSGLKLEDEASRLDSLTDRELEVFRFLGQGGGTRRIAERLGISVKTVEAHIANIKKKMRITSGTELQHRAFLWREPAPGPETA